jgi:hypothetical protein
MGLGDIWFYAETAYHELQMIKKRYEMEDSDKMEDKAKEHIDRMSYYKMFRLRRFAGLGHPYFLGATGDYFAKVMAEKEAKLAPGQRTQISKDIGWEG